MCALCIKTLLPVISIMLQNHTEMELLASLAILCLFNYCTAISITDIYEKMLKKGKIGYGFIILDFEF